MHSIKVGIGLYALLLITTSCTKQDAGSFHMTDIDGVLTRIYEYGFQPQADPYRVVEERIIADNQSEDTYLLTAAYPGAIGDDGTLFVLDSREAMIYVFSKDGGLLSRFGGTGQGPGEFSGLTRVILDGDYLYCPDLMSNRLTILTREGKFVRQYRPNTLEPLGGRICLFGDRNERKFLTFGRVYEGSDRPLFRLSRWDNSLTYIDTLMEIPITEVPVWMRNIPQVPFTNKVPSTALKEDLPFAWYIGDQPRIDFIDPVSLKRWAVTIPHEPIAISSEMKGRVLARYEGRSDPEEIRAIRFPGFLPHFNQLFWDFSNRLWAQEYTDPWAELDSVKYYVFSTDGKWLFTQSLPLLSLFPDESLFDRSGFYLSSRLDDGTSVIRYYRLEENNSLMGMNDRGYR